jgi:hypothetical protein
VLWIVAMNFPNDSDTQFARERLATGCESMKHLLAGLLDAKGRVAEEVHAIRKLGKSLRGGFSLFRLEDPSSAEIQAIGRLLSGPRDAVSRLKTWNHLAWDADPGTAAAIHGLLDQQTHSAARRPPPETIAWCVARVDAACQQLQQLPSEGLTETLVKGLKKLERRALKRCLRLDHQEPEDFHEARKALKAWLGATGFLPDAQIPHSEVFHHLAELLGDENDLATLSVWLEEHGFTARFAPDLWKALLGTRRKLQKKIIKETRKLGTKEKAGPPPSDPAPIQTATE